MAKKVTTKTKSKAGNKENLMLFFSALGCAIMGWQLYLTMEQMNQNKIK